jgi:hypothetical protein
MLNLTFVLFAVVSYSNWLKYADDDNLLLCRRGSLLSVALLLYTLSSPINGYFGGSLYSQLGGESVSEVTYFRIEL